LNVPFLAWFQVVSNNAKSRCPRSYEHVVKYEDYCKMLKLMQLCGETIALRG